MNTDENLKLTDLIPVQILQKIQNAFAEMARMAALTTDADGTAITEGSRFTDFCTEYCRKSPTGKKRCEECDKNGFTMALENEKSVSYYCHANLVDFAAPIMLEGKVIGGFIGGQVLTEEPDYDEIRRIAREIGVDEEKFVDEVKKVQIIPKAAVDRATKFIYEFANILSDMAYKEYVSRQLSEEAMQASVLKSDFLANMSHEIRTPMNAILGMTEMALREKISPNAKEYLHQVQSAGKNLLVIINDILDFSKIESGKMDIIEVNYEIYAMISDIVNIINSRIGSKDIEFVVDIPNHLPLKLCGDNVRIQQILINLLNNAVKFTKKGKVTLKIEFEYIDDDNVMMRASVSDTGIGIKPENIDKIFKSFQQVDSKRNRNIEGTGLGLAITKQLLTLMNGDVSVESEYGKGSTFKIWMPQKFVGSHFELTIPTYMIHVTLIVKSRYVKEQLIKDLKAVNAEIIDQTEDTGSLRHMEKGYIIIEEDLIDDNVEKFAVEYSDIRFIVVAKYDSEKMIMLSNVRLLRKPVFSLALYAAMGLCEEFVREYDNSDDELMSFTAPDAKLLIVDDNHMNLTVAKGLLEPFDMQIDVAESAAEAIELVKQKKYDLVFMDHMMPEIDGLEASRIIREGIPLYRDVPIIAFTANVVDGAKDMFLKAGMNDFVPKPVELKKMVAKIQQWLSPEKIIYSEEKINFNKNDEANTIKIEGLDTDSAMQLLGNEEIFWQILESSYHSMDKKAEKIRKFLAEGNIKNYTIEVHSLKSSSRQIGAMKLADMAARLEIAGNQNDTEYISKKTEEAITELFKCRDILAKYFEGEKTKEKKKATDDEIIALLDELITAVDEMDTLKIDEVADKLSEYEFQNEQLEYIGQIRNAAESFDIDACSEIALKWKEQLT